MQNIPDGVTISRLSYPVTVKGERRLSNILLLGVKQRTVIHASYVNDFLEALKPESVFMQVPPDLPLFIKTKGKEASGGGYRSRWFNFLRHGQDASFYVNTKPQYLTDVIMSNKDRLKMLMDRSIEPSTREFEVGSKVIYSRHRALSTMTLAPDAMLTPFLYGYNNAMNRNVKTVIGDMPMLIYRERVAKSLHIAKAKEIFAECVSEWGDNSNFQFNPMVKYADIFMKPRVTYIAEVLRQLA